jgi:hypothetical protein
LKDNRQELAASMVEQVKNSMDEKEYSQKVSDMIGIIETPVVFNLKDQSYSLENDDAAKMFDFYGLKISVDTQDEGLAYLIEEFSGTSEKVEAVAKLVSGQFKSCLEDETSENESIKKIATKKLMGFLESAKDMFKDSKLAGKIGDYAMASAVVAVMAASGVSYVKMMKDVNSTHFHNNVKSLVDGHVEVQGNLLE